VEVTAKGLAKKAIKEKKMLAGLLQGSLPKEDQTRYISFKAPMFISEEYPELLYPHWNRSVNLIERENTYSKYIGSYLIASLAVVDTDNRFEEIFDKYHSLVNDKNNNSGCACCWQLWKDCEGKIGVASQDNGEVAEHRQDTPHDKS
jgi:hypothetical protein